uniref:Uncharacterized protein n=1 Tax=Meloidogyne incognita TaxID=6306 RepID=A0A914NKA0_MELIC
MSPSHYLPMFPSHYWTNVPFALPYQCPLRITLPMSPSHYPTNVPFSQLLHVPFTLLSKMSHSHNRTMFLSDYLPISSSPYLPTFPSHRGCAETDFMKQKTKVNLKSERRNTKKRSKDKGERAQPVPHYNYRLK